MDSRPNRLENIEEQAAYWLARQHSSTWSEAEAHELQAWLNQSTGNRIEFLRIRNTWSATARLQALGAGVPKGKIPERHQWGDDRFAGGSSERKPAKVSTAARVRIAASVIVALGVGFYVAINYFGADSYATPVGRVRTITLPDGSEVTLNTDTRITTEISEQRRLIKLERGEAYFDVRKDPARPFIVQAGDRAITAVGTAFLVRRSETSVRVTVTEGSIMMAADSGSGVLLSAGETAQATQTHVSRAKIGSGDLGKALSWRSGYINFDDVLLSDAVAEFNRYATRKIVIHDESLANLHVGGNFRTNNIDAFLWVLENGLPIQATEEGNTIALRRR